MTLFVLGHEREVLTSCQDGPRIRHVYLPDLDPDNDLAESRVFHARLIDDCQTEFVGLCSQSWDWKYVWRAMPLALLDTLPRAENVVWCADLAESNWLEQSERDHPGMEKIVEQLAEAAGVNDLRRSVPWSNNVVAHRSVVAELAVWHRRWWPWVVERFGRRPPYCTGDFDGRRHGSYLAERLSMAFFCWRMDLEFRQMPA